MKDKDNMMDKIFQAFPILQGSERKVRQEIFKHVMITRIPAGKMIFSEGDECKHLALILSGTVRIYKPAESGREITLYRLGKGESCILTASCIFSRSSFPAIAVTEEDTEAAVVPAQVFHHWINHYEIWRSYVFNLLSRRLSDIIMTLEEVAFRRMDMRIAEFLLQLSAADKDEIRTKHQDIAMELGTSREVVSRILKHFESEHLISMGRGVILIRDAERLKKKLVQQ